MSEPRGLYFEDYNENLDIVSAGRTVTETDIVQFCMLSGDWNQLHCDAEFAKTTPFGQRIAHGLLGLSIGTGLGGSMGFIEGTAIAFLGLTWKFVKPILIGDTIRLRVQPEQEARREPGGRHGGDRRRGAQPARRGDPEGRVDGHGEAAGVGATLVVARWTWIWRV